MREPRGNGERLQKLLARRGFGSRREIERWIVAGRLTINGRPAELGARVKRGDRLRLDGKAIELPPRGDAIRVIALNKPEGAICTRRDPQGRKTIYSLLPTQFRRRFVSVGRLDIATRGVLLFTNSGELANRLMHPRYRIDREYAVRVLGRADESQLSRLRDGIDIDGQRCAFDDIVSREGDGANRWYYCVVRQGRNREVRRLWESQGFAVNRLIRVRFGNVVLPRDLRAGRYFELKGLLLTDLLTLVGMSAKQRV